MDPEHEGRSPLPPSPGVLTKTIVRGPATKYILQARIRRSNLDDVVFIGEDFVHVKQLCEGGHLRSVALKDDFDARIRVAKVLRVGGESAGEVALIKQEPQETYPQTTIPSHMLILTMESAELICLHLRDAGNGRWIFVQHSNPMPRYEHRLNQPGEHLAVERRSRAVAAAASERELIIWPRRTSNASHAASDLDSSDEAPLGQPRFFKVDGVIMQMDFLNPDDLDHIVLLLIVLDRRLVKAVWIDWHEGDDLYHAQLHSPQPLESATSVTSLLIPLRNAAFLLICGKEIKRWKNLLSGSASADSYDIILRRSVNPGHSPKEPVWVSWCRPCRSANAVREKDHVYLAREDGLVYLLQIALDDRLQASPAGDFQCHVGTAFASLGDDWSPDILAVAGDMSTGRVVYIGQWPSIDDVGEQTWDEAMEMNLLERIPNWTAITDVVVTNLPHSHNSSIRARDGIFVTSGKQPYGAVTELRQGYEAQQILYFTVEEFGGVTDAWALPLNRTGFILLVLSNPMSTILLSIGADGEDISVFEASSAMSLDASRRTLAMASTENGQIIQVSDTVISITAEAQDDLGQTRVRRCGTGQTILGATVAPECSTIVTVERDQDTFALRTFAIGDASPDENDRSTAMEVDSIAVLGECRLESEPLAVTTVAFANRLYAACACADGIVYIFSLSNARIAQQTFFALPGFNDIPAASDYLVNLRSTSRDEILLMCGLRDGRAFSVILQERLDSISIKETFVTRFGATSVKLTQLHFTTACATSGLDTCYVRWDGASNLLVHSIYITDKDRPEFSQGMVEACARMPPADSLSSPYMAEKLLLVSGQDVMLTSLIPEVISIPRHIRVSGTPNRIIYAEHQRSLVVASLCTGVRNFPSTGSRPDERRYIHPAIEFIPSRRSRSSFTYHMQPGELVNAIAEWSFRKPEDDKLYSFILVAGSYLRRDGVSRRGRITFLQPRSERWEVKDVAQATTREFDEPVWTVAMLDDSTYVASVGDSIIASRFEPNKRRLESLCKPLKLASRGVCITIDDQGQIHVSTAKDSVVTLQLQRLSDVDQRYELVVRCTAPRAAVSLHHTVLASNTQSPITLLSTRESELYGLVHSEELETRFPDRKPSSSKLIFQARLPHSLTRFRQCSIRPPWQHSIPAGALELRSRANPEHLLTTLAASTTGSLTVISILAEALWRRLFWLQRLIEWDVELSPLSYQNAAYLPLPLHELSSTSLFRKDHMNRVSRSLPVGISSSPLSDGSGVENETLPLNVVQNRNTLQDKHIDGEVLVRLLNYPAGPRTKLRSILLRHAGRTGLEAQGRIDVLDDGNHEPSSRSTVSDWIRRNLDKELDAVNGIVEETEALVHGWM